MLLSVIVPCYNEGKVIELTHKEIRKVLDEDATRSDYEYEVIYVNDGSQDNTIDIIENFSKGDSHSKYISFSRNFGKESAMLAGLTYAGGDCVVIMDADLQHPPRLIPTLLQYYREGYDQVITKRTRTGDNKIRTAFSRLYYRLVNSLVDVELLDGVGDFRLLSRRAVDALLSMSEYNRFSKGLFSWIGFKCKVIQIENSERAAGETKWSFRSLLQYGIDGMISFNNKPLRICFLFGSICIGFSIIYILYLLINMFLHGIDSPGYITTIFAVLFMGGVQLFSIGVLGEYIGRIYYEVKKRPHFLIDKTNIEKPKNSMTHN